MDALALGLFGSRLAAICDESGARLRQAAFSPNIRERLDYSCAVFDEHGELAAQAAHIPVHLGSMAFALRDVVGDMEWRDGDMLVFNDPRLGGTHLPDITVVAPVFVNAELVGFVANRAHHADIGAATPGSMPLSESLEEEGLLIPPQWLVRVGDIDWKLIGKFVETSCNPDRERGDYAAQISACRLGVQRLVELIRGTGAEEWRNAVREMNAYAARLANRSFSALPEGEWTFEDAMDDDGHGSRDCVIRATVNVRKGDDAVSIRVDFDGSSPHVRGNINCPLAVTVSAVYYVFRCLLPDYAPSCAGTFKPLEVRAPEGLVNAPAHVAVAGGNVETSSRIVDCVLGALALAAPQFAVAASQGTMNNLALGASEMTEAGGARHPPWSYYETMGGGFGASASGDGLSATQSHMTNTRNTSAEEIELNYPLRLAAYAIREDSGGKGRHRGGDGLVRRFEFLAPTTVTLLTERRLRAPWGAAGGGDGATGRNEFNGRVVPGKTRLHAGRGDRLTVMTPGGGAWGTG